MRAPHEVFLKPNAFGLMLPSDGDMSGEVRYLRADLTCGECEMWDTDEGMSDGCGWCAAYKPHENRTTTHPACMTFVPKEPK